MRRLYHMLEIASRVAMPDPAHARGCDGTDRLVLGTETNEPYYRQGDQLKRQGRYQEALGAYLKVIGRRNQDAPESHLEAGLIYQQYIKDPIYAIYHSANISNWSPIRARPIWCGSELMRRCGDFARTLPARPWRTRCCESI